MAAPSGWFTEDNDTKLSPTQVEDGIYIPTSDEYIALQNVPANTYARIAEIKLRGSDGNASTRHRLNNLIFAESINNDLAISEGHVDDTSRVLGYESEALLGPFEFTTPGLGYDIVVASSTTPTIKVGNKYLQVTSTGEELSGGVTIPFKRHYGPDTSISIVPVFSTSNRSGMWEVSSIPAESEPWKVFTGNSSDKWTGSGTTTRFMVHSAETITARAMAIECPTVAYNGFPKKFSVIGHTCDGTELELATRSNYVSGGLIHFNLDGLDCHTIEIEVSETYFNDPVVIGQIKLFNPKIGETSQSLVNLAASISLMPVLNAPELDGYYIKSSSEDSTSVLYRITGGSQWSSKLTDGWASDGVPGEEHWVEMGGFESVVGGISIHTYWGGSANAGMFPKDFSIYDAETGELLKGVTEYEKEDLVIINDDRVFNKIRIVFHETRDGTFNVAFDTLRIHPGEVDDLRVGIDYAPADVDSDTVAYITSTEYDQAHPIVDIEHMFDGDVSTYGQIPYDLSASEVREGRVGQWWSKPTVVDCVILNGIGGRREFMNGPDGEPITFELYGTNSNFQHPVYDTLLGSVTITHDRSNTAPVVIWDNGDETFKHHYIRMVEKATAPVGSLYLSTVIFKQWAPLTPYTLADEIQPNIYKLPTTTPVTMYRAHHTTDAAELSVTIRNDNSEDMGIERVGVFQMY